LANNLPMACWLLVRINKRCLFIHSQYSVA
jgi:hypothetical protein